METKDSGALLAAFTFYFCIAFVLPTLRVWRQTGRPPYVLPSTDDAHGFVTLCMKGVMGGLFAYLAAQVMWPEVELGRLHQFDTSWVRLMGWSGLGMATLWTVVAQFQMGKSWRIGIDTAQATELVQAGLFRYSRNPIFLGMRVSMLATFMIAPNAVTLALFLAGDLAIQFQVRLEEAFLVQRHGVAYETYREQVRRWL